MQAPFDIAADLDTPVSAYLKLGSLKPRFLLESVEGGERLARYSFLGFGNAVEVRMDPDVARINGNERGAPDKTSRNTSMRCGAPWRSRRARSLTMACRSPAGWWAYQATTSCACSNPCRSTPTSRTVCRTRLSSRRSRYSFSIT